MGYKIEKNKSVNDSFVLFRDNKVLCVFSRQSFRKDLESYAGSNGLSSQWIGSILRMFLKQYPSPIHFQSRPIIERFQPDVLVEHLRSKGYVVSKELHTSLDDLTIIRHLEKNGYLVEGNGYEPYRRLITFN